MNFLKMTIKNKFLYKLWILYDNKIDVSEGIDINKTSASKERNICDYWYFLDKWFKFQPYVCNGCHDVLMTSTYLLMISIDDMNLSNTAVININSVDYHGN